MTLPSAIRPKEGQQPGTPFEAFRPGAPLRPLSFTLDAEVVDEYARLLGAELAWYHAPPGGGGPLAPATSPALFLLALLYRTYPPVQGLVLTHVSFESLRPWAPGMAITGTGAITETSERRGRKYVSWRAEFSDDASGRLLTRASNTFTLPPEQLQATTPEMRRPGQEPPGGVPVTPLRLKRPAGPLLPGTRLELEQGIAVSQELIDWYGRLNGDLDMVHYDAAYAAALGYRAPIDHGLMHAAYASELLCQAFGLRWLAGGRFALKWTAPVFPGDLVYPIAEVGEAQETNGEGRLPLQMRCENGEGRTVLVGEASVPVA